MGRYTVSYGKEALKGGVRKGMRAGVLLISILIETSSMTMPELRTEKQPTWQTVRKVR